MSRMLTIGAVAREVGLSVDAIRFYEAEGLIPPPARSDGGYRLYTPSDLRRLRLVRQARLLGLSLAEVRDFAEQAFASECIDFAGQLLDRIARQRGAIDRRIEELSVLRAELDALERHVRHSQARARPGRMVATCGYCPLIDDEGREVNPDEG
jgi:MerR family transcriptional regulator, copper efflux regulator